MKDVRAGLRDSAEERALLPYAPGSVEPPRVSSVPVGPPFATDRPVPRTVPDLVDDALDALTSLLRAKDVRVEHLRGSEREIRRHATLRRVLLIVLMDTLETTREGGTVTVRSKDLGGGRVEVVIEDASAAGTLVDRETAPPDHSGRAKTLSLAHRDLERDHAARLYGECEHGHRRLLMDLGFPAEG